MSPFVINIISSHSITIPALLIILRWRSIAAAYYPFAVFLWIGALNEVISLEMILHDQPNMANSNLYVLLEYLLIIWQFQRWNHWKRGSTVLFCFAGMVIWIADNFWWHSVMTNNSLFRMVYSAVIVLLSMIQLSRLTMQETARPFRNAQFLLCLIFVIYYSFKTYYESFNLLDEGVSDQFYVWLWLVLNIVNLFTNLCYTYAVLCIRKKIPFTLPY